MAVFLYLASQNLCFQDTRRTFQDGDASLPLRDGDDTESLRLVPRRKPIGYESQSPYQVRPQFWTHAHTHTHTHFSGVSWAIGVMESACVWEVGFG